MTFSVSETKSFFSTSQPCLLSCKVLPFYWRKGEESFLLYPHNLTSAFKRNRISKYKNIICQDNPAMFWNQALGCENWLTFHQRKVITLVFWQVSCEHTSEWEGTIYVHCPLLSEVILLQGPLSLTPLSHYKSLLTNRERYARHPKLGGKPAVCCTPEFHWIRTLQYLMNL